VCYAFFDIVSNGNDKYGWLKFIDDEKKIIPLSPSRKVSKN
jgi:hypothetical protein